jgi:hypothetical protein
MDKIALDLVFLDADTRRTSFNQEVGDGIQRRGVHADRDLQPVGRHNFLCHSNPIGINQRKLQ